MRSALAATVLLTALTAPAAHAVPVTSVSVHSDGRDYIGQGVPRVAHRLGPVVSAEPTTFAAGGIALRALTGDEGTFIDIAPPPGETLRPHNWTLVDDYPFQRAGRPGLAVRVGHRACNDVTGSLEVLDVGYDGQGAVDRLWALFDQHCEGRRSSAFGEVRWNARVPDEAAHVTPAVVRWPVLDSWWPAAPATVVYHGTAPAASVGLAGGDAAHFNLRSDGCTGRTPPCTVELGFAPSVPGARRARLEIVDASGARHAVTLEGFLHGGTTQADIRVLDGDVAAPAEDRGLHSHGPTDAFFTGVEFAPIPAVRLHVQDNDDLHQWWTLDLYGGDGQRLQPGVSYPRVQGNVDGPGPGVRLVGGPAWCQQTAGAFTVHSITHLPDGRLRSLDTTLERRCYPDERPAAHATWRFRAGDTVPLPDWMVPGPRPGIDAPTDLPATQPAAVPIGFHVPPAQPAAGVTAPGAQPSGCRQGGVRLGTARADRLRGTRQADVIRGRGGNDLIHALAGVDCVFGGRGADLLVGGPGRDLLDCGPGRLDRVVVDRGDRVRHCERRLSRGGGRSVAVSGRGSLRRPPARRR